MNAVVKSCDLASSALQLGSPIEVARETDEQAANTTELASIVDDAAEDAKNATDEIAAVDERIREQSVITRNPGSQRLRIGYAVMR